MIVMSFRSITVDEYEKSCMTFQLLYAFHRTPFGKCLIAVTDIDEAVAYLAFVDDDDETEAIRNLKAKWPLTRMLEESTSVGNKTGTIVAKIFRFGDVQLRVLMKGTHFQIKVWRSLTRIPEGTVVTYEEVARMVDCKAAIAVGSAIAQNYIAYIVPCHRVVAKCVHARGKYAWGMERKKAILEYEKQRTLIW